MVQERGSQAGPESCPSPRAAVGLGESLGPLCETSQLSQPW